MNKFIGIIFGPNGSGKGTLAENIAKEFDYLHYDSGRNLREWAIQNKRKDVIERIDRGELAEDETLDQSITDYFSQNGIHKKLLLDGIPRRLSQVNLVQKLCKEYGFIPLWIIVLHAPIEVILERLKERVVAPDGKNYHMTLNPPPKHYKLSDLKPRPDDDPEIIKKRYEYYVTNTMECLSDDFFLDTKVATIDATQSITDVFEEATLFVKEQEIEYENSLI